MKRLTDKTCVITGAARGIGAAIAARFLKEGATVILTDKDETTLTETATKLSATALRLDVEREEDWAALAAAHPAIDVLVNNAGITGFESDARPHDPEHASLEDWRAVHRVNLEGTSIGRAAGREGV